MYYIKLKWEKDLKQAFAKVSKLKYYNIYLNQW